MRWLSGFLLGKPDSNMNLSPRIQVKVKGESATNCPSDLHMCAMCACVCLHRETHTHTYTQFSTYTPIAMTKNKILKILSLHNYLLPSSIHLSWLDRDFSESIFASALVFEIQSLIVQGSLEHAL